MVSIQMFRCPDLAEHSFLYSFLSTVYFLSHLYLFFSFCYFLFCIEVENPYQGASINVCILVNIGKSKVKTHLRKHGVEVGF